MADLAKGNQEIVPPGKESEFSVGTCLPAGDILCDLA